MLRLKIIDVKTFLVNPGGNKNFLFLKVETDEGISGWGEASVYPNREKSVEYIAKQIGLILIGRDPFHIRHLQKIIYRNFAGKRGDWGLYCALSGIEQALWDVLGKKLDTPVYNLLGGPCRDKIRVYANHWSHSLSKAPPEEYVAIAEKLVKKGYTALKWNPLSAAWPTGTKRYPSDKDIRAGVENMKAMREAFGPDIDLLIEVGKPVWTPMDAIRAAKKLEDYGPFWYEEPIPCEDGIQNVEELAKITAAINIPVVTGEALYRKQAFRNIFEKRAVDIINPDPCQVGGILEMMDIAAMADAYYVAVSPHGWYSWTIGLAASVQMCACMPNFLIQELIGEHEPGTNEIGINPLKMENGYIKIPTKPGLGVELDEDALVKYPYKEVKRTFPHYEDEIL